MEKMRFHYDVVDDSTVQEYYNESFTQKIRGKEYNRTARRDYAKRFLGTFIYPENQTEHREKGEKRRQ